MEFARCWKKLTLLKMLHFLEFLGLINYCHCHLPSFSSVLEPLHDLLRKNKEWKWGNAEEKAFQECKLLLKESNLLNHYNPKKPLIIAVMLPPMV